MPTGDVEITVLDGGAGVVVVPASSVQVVIGACSGGTANTIVATRNANTLATAVGYGPAVDAAAMAIAAGGTVLFMKATTATPGVASAVTAFATGTSVVTVTGAPYDAYLVKMLVTAGGTRGTAGIRFKLSVDAGRTYGPEISLGTATTYAMAGTGLTLAFGAGTMISGESVTFGCTEPLVAAAGIQACLVALEASPYAVSGWGSMHLVGPRSGTDASSIQGYLNTMAATESWTRAICGARDVALPTAYGGAGESEATWYAAVALDFAAVEAKRICVCAGHYNMNSAFPIPSAGTPRMRRSLSWALAARQVQIAPQTHAGRVSDGSLSQIIVDSTNDPSDGFVYHDEYLTPALDSVRFATARKRKGKPGYYLVNPNLMSPSDSVFKLLPSGNVMDIGCSLLHQTMTDKINSDVKLNVNGTISEEAAQELESIARAVLRDQMLSRRMISDFAFTIDRTNNVRTTSVVNFAATLYSRGYILEIDGTVGFGS